MAFGILYDYLMGQTTHAFDYFGAHFGECTLPVAKKGEKAVTLHGVWFRLYAPLAEDVSVIGDWNGMSAPIN